jgi:NAD(P) transhydrogenase subunit alpha
VRSMGATFVELDLESLEGSGGYAREMGEERARRQRELLTPYVGASDVLITTAAVPGRPAPLLVTTEMVEAMRPGSVLVDLAAESGGNCELSRPGEDVEHHGVLVLGLKDAPSAMAVHASQLYARNVVNLLLLMTADGEVVPDFEDEIVAATCVTRKEPA